MGLVCHAIALLLAAALPAAPTVERVSEGGRYERLATPYLEADAHGKLRFLEDLLLRRSDSAIRVYLPPAELERQRGRNREILSLAAQGRELTQSGLLKLLAEVDRQEQEAIQKLRRDYAYSTAQAFHGNRTEFDKWSEAWRRIEQAWQQDGRPFDWQPRMIAWLGQASAQQAEISLAVRRDRNPLLGAIPPRTGPRIQQMELEARIAGYNLALSRLISELHLRSDWSVEQLGASAGELADLATTRHDLSLYWNLLPGARRAHMTPLDPLDDAISLLASRTSKLRRQLESASADHSPRTAWELRRLDEVSRRLATLAGPRS